jgi:hypothetical protein
MTGKELGGQPATGHGDGLGNVFTGLTKREWFAGLAMQGQLSNQGHLKPIAVICERTGLLPINVVAQASVQYADALLTELAKEGQ